MRCHSQCSMTFLNAQVLGEDTVHLFGDAPQQKSRPDSSTDSDSMHSMLSLQEQQQGIVTVSYSTASVFVANFPVLHQEQSRLSSDHDDFDVGCACVLHPHCHLHKRKASWRPVTTFLGYFQV